MPLYVYRCAKDEAEFEIQHPISDCEDSRFFCPDCGEVMTRVPQPFRWGNSSWDVLGEKFDQGWRNYKAKVERRRRFGMYQKPQRDWENIDGEIVEMRR